MTPNAKPYSAFPPLQRIFVSLTAVLLLVFSSSLRAEQFPSHAEMAKLVAQRARTGSLLFSEGDCLAVKVFSGSPYTHVAAVVVEDGKPMVYDTSNGHGVRRQTIEQYIEFLAPDELHVLQPTFRFTPKLTEPYHQHLREQLGRPYAVKHHLTGERCEGLHCSEYVTDALMAGDIVRANNPTKVSPASLLKGILQAELYRETLTLNLEVPEQPTAEGDSWCEQMWIETKVCTKSFCLAIRRKVFCR